MDDSRDMFLRVISHEIRTPLNAILGMASLLLDSGIGERERDYAASIQSSGTVLLGLIDAVLDLNALRQGEIVSRPHTFDLRECVDDVAGALAPEARSKGLGFEVVYEPGLPELVVGDMVRIKEVLRHLIDNAIKFTSRGGVEVLVSRECAEPDPLIHFQVRDTGPGIPIQRMADIFEPFTSLESSLNRRHRGAGLGLPLARGLAELLGGRLDVASVPGEGSTFDTVLPLAVPAARTGGEEQRRTASDTPESSVPAGTPAPSAMRILLVEDNVMNQKVALSVLSRFGCTAAIAGNGVEALEALARTEYDIVLMDVQMPEMDGLEATREIHRRHEPRERPWIIALTANTTASDRRLCEEAGMDDFVGKPIDAQQLRDTLVRATRSVIERRGMPSSESVHVLDREVLMQYLAPDEDGDMDMLREVVRMYLMDLPLKMQELAQSLERRDQRAIAFFAHNIQGSCATLGAERLAAHCRQLAQECALGEFSRARVTMSSIEQQLSALRDALAEIGLAA